MKKISLLAAFVAVCSFSYAQTKIQQNSPNRVQHLSKAGKIETATPTKEKGIGTGYNKSAMKKAPIFSEDFEGVTVPALPAGWTKGCVCTDGGFFTGDNTQTRIFACPDPTDYFPVPAHTIFAVTNDDCCNCNKSADYLNMPSIDLTGLFNHQISFDVYKRENSAYMDSAFLEVSVDSGVTWNKILNIQNFTINVWKRVDVNLSAYDTMPDVLIRFHYDDLGNWGYGLCIDNVIVDEIPDNNLVLDPGVTYLDTFQTPVYSQIPYRQGGTITFDGRVSNKGLLTQNNVILNVVVTKGADTLFNQNSPSITLIPDEDSLLTVNSCFSQSVLGSYFVNFTVNSDSTDEYPADNIATRFFAVSDTVFARDHDNPGFQLSLSSYFGAIGPGYAFANFYETTGADTATSISVMLGNSTIVGTVIRGNIYDYNDANPNGVGVSIAETNFYTIQASDTSGNFLTLPLTSELPLTGPTNYFAAIHEFGSDSAMTIAAENNTGVITALLFDQGDNGWSGIGAIPYIRLNLKTSAFSKDTIVCGSIALNASPGASYLWSNGATTQQIVVTTSDSISVTVFNICGAGITTDTIVVTVIPLPLTPTISANGDTLTSSTSTGNQWYRNNNPIPIGGNNQTFVHDLTQPGTYTYYVTVVDSITGCESLPSNTLVFTISGINEINPGMMFNIYPNPNNGRFVIEFNNAKKENYIIEVRNVIGQLIYAKNVDKISGEFFGINLSDVYEGVYFMSVGNSSGIRTAKLIVY